MDDIADEFHPQPDAKANSTTSVDSKQKNKMEKRKRFSEPKNESNKLPASALGGITLPIDADSPKLSSVKDKRLKNKSKQVSVKQGKTNATKIKNNDNSQTLNEVMMPPCESCDEKRTANNQKNIQSIFKTKRLRKNEKSSILSNRESTQLENNLKNDSDSKECTNRFQEQETSTKHLRLEAVDNNDQQFKQKHKPSLKCLQETKIKRANNGNEKPLKMSQLKMKKSFNTNANQKKTSIIDSSEDSIQLDDQTEVNKFASKNPIDLHTVEHSPRNKNETNFSPPKNGKCQIKKPDIEYFNEITTNSQKMKKKATKNVEQNEVDKNQIKRKRSASKNSRALKKVCCSVPKSSPEVPNSNFETINGSQWESPKHLSILVPQSASYGSDSALCVQSDDLEVVIKNHPLFVNDEVAQEEFSQDLEIRNGCISETLPTLNTENETNERKSLLTHDKKKSKLKLKHLRNPDHFQKPATKEVSQLFQDLEMKNGRISGTQSSLNTENETNGRKSFLTQKEQKNKPRLKNSRKPELIKNTNIHEASQIFQDLEMRNGCISETLPTLNTENETNGRTLLLTQTKKKNKLRLKNSRKPKLIKNTTIQDLLQADIGSGETELKDESPVSKLTSCNSQAASEANIFHSQVQILGTKSDKKHTRRQSVNCSESNSTLGPVVYVKVIADIYIESITDLVIHNDEEKSSRRSSCDQANETDNDDYTTSTEIVKVEGNRRVSKCEKNGLRSSEKMQLQKRQLSTNHFESREVVASILEDILNKCVEKKTEEDLWESLIATARPLPEITNQRILTENETDEEDDIISPPDLHLGGCLPFQYDYFLEDDSSRDWSDASQDDECDTQPTNKTKIPTRRRPTSTKRSSRSRPSKHATSTGPADVLLSSTIPTSKRIRQSTSIYSISVGSSDTMKNSISTAEKVSTSDPLTYSDPTVPTDELVNQLTKRIRPSVPIYSNQTAADDINQDSGSVDAPSLGDVYLFDEIDSWQKDFGKGKRKKYVNVRMLPIKDNIVKSEDDLTKSK